VKADVVCSIVVVGKLVDADVNETTEEVVLVSTLAGVFNSVVVCNIVLIEAVVTLDDPVIAKTVEVVTVVVGSIVVVGVIAAEKVVDGAVAISVVDSVVVCNIVLVKCVVTEDKEVVAERVPDVGTVLSTTVVVCNIGVVGTMVDKDVDVTA
jgi:hypothetical protein